MTQLSPRKKYCRYCGQKMNAVVVGAEDLIRYGDMGCGSSHPYSRFDENTGKRQHVYEYICPSYKTNFLNIAHHDKYWLDEIFNTYVVKYK